MVQTARQSLQTVISVRGAGCSDRTFRDSHMGQTRAATMAPTLPDHGVELASNRTAVRDPAIRFPLRRTARAVALLGRFSIAVRHCGKLATPWLTSAVPHDRHTVLMTNYSPFSGRIVASISPRLSRPLWTMRSSIGKEIVAGI